MPNHVQLVPTAADVDSKAQVLADIARRLAAQLSATVDAASILSCADMDALEMMQSLLATAEILSKEAKTIATSISDDIGRRVQALYSERPEQPILSNAAR